MRNFFPGLGLLIVALAVGGCGSSSTAPDRGTVTVLTLSPGSVLQGGNVQVKAVVTGSAALAPATGTVTFQAGSQTLGKVALNAGSATLQPVATSSYAVGATVFTASYSGDATHMPSQSAASLAVQTDTTTTLAYSPSTIQQGQQFALIAQVSRNFGGSGSATGTVTFYNGAQAIASAAVENGTASGIVPAGAIAQGSYQLSAGFAGDDYDLPSSSNVLSGSFAPAADVLTYRYNPQRTGVQPAETTLSPATVNNNSFGQLFAFPVSGWVYAEPLYVSNYAMADGLQHNVLIVATAAGFVYAFDADNNNPASGYLWRASVIPSGELAVTSQDIGCSDTRPNTTVIGTPVIDRARGLIYVVAKTKAVANGASTFVQRIHALNLADGSERQNGPVAISASVQGSGAGSVNGVITFDPLVQNQRAALLEANDAIWIAWASHCDEGNYHGWIMGYDADDVSKQLGVFNTTPNGSQGGVWMAGGGPSTDHLGNVYFAAGNGDFDGDEDNASNFGDTVHRLAIAPADQSLSMGSWFSPTNEAYLDQNDFDLGTVSALLIEDPASGTSPHLLVTADKTGHIYLLDRNDLGGFQSGHNQTNGDVQDFSYGSQLFANLTFFNQRLYVGADNVPLTAFEFTPGSASAAGYFATTPASVTAASFSNTESLGGVQVTVSANAQADGIAWGLDLTGHVLYAYDAGNLGNLLWSSATDPARDAPPAPVKFTIPTVANARVYVGGQGSVAAYGLLP